MKKRKTKFDFESGDLFEDFPEKLRLILSLLLFISLCLHLLATVFCLLIPVIGSIFFLLNVFGNRGSIIELNELSSNWIGGDGSMSAIPIYLGLMAIAGALLFYTWIYLWIKASTTYIGKSEEEWEEETDKQLLIVESYLIRPKHLIMGSKLICGSFLSSSFFAQITITFDEICSRITNQDYLSFENNPIDVKFKRNISLLFLILCLRQLIELVLIFNSVTKVNTPTKYMLRFLANDRLDNLKAEGKQLTTSVMFDLLGSKQLKEMYKYYSAYLHKANMWNTIDNKEYKKIVKDKLLKDYKYLSAVYGVVYDRFGEWDNNYSDDVSKDEVNKLLLGLDWNL